MGRQWYLYHLVSHFVHLFFWTSGCTSWKMSTSSRMASKISRAIRSGTWAISNKFCVEAGSNHTKLLESVSTCWKCPRKWPWQELSNRIATLRLATGVYIYRPVSVMFRIQSFGRFIVMLVSPARFINHMSVFVEKHVDMVWDVYRRQDPLSNKEPLSIRSFSLALIQYNIKT